MQDDARGVEHVHGPVRLALLSRLRHVLRHFSRGRRGRATRHGGARFGDALAYGSSDDVLAVAFGKQRGDGRLREHVAHGRQVSQCVLGHALMLYPYNRMERAEVAEWQTPRT